MDYIISTLDAKTGEEKDVSYLVKKLKDGDRLFALEMDAVPWYDSKLNMLPVQDNIITLTLNDFPYKQICQFVQHFRYDAKINWGYFKHYTVCMLNRRPAAIRVLATEQMKWFPNFIYSMYPYDEDHESKSEQEQKPILDIYLKDGLVYANGYQYYPDSDLSKDFTIPRVELTEDITETARAEIGWKYGQKFPHCVYPPVEYFESKVDLIHEGTHTLSEKLVKNFIFHKPFICLGVDQRLGLKEHGFMDYFNIDSHYQSVYDFTLEICQNPEYLNAYPLLETAEHNYERAVDIHRKYWHFAEFVMTREHEGPIMTEDREIMDGFTELLSTI